MEKGRALEGGESPDFMSNSEQEGALSSRVLGTVESPCTKQDVGGPGTSIFSGRLPHNKLFF